MRSDVIQEVLAVTDWSIDTLLRRLLVVAEAYAMAPISEFYVGCVALGLTGNLYLGMNMEFPGHVLNASVHGEQAAIINAALNTEHGVAALAIGGLPCGHCRQFINELSTANTIRLLTPNGTYSMTEALPNDFGPRTLGNQGGFMQPEQHGLTLESAGDDPVVTRALDAANRSYAPYSSSHAGVAVELTGGAIFHGFYIENAAFNPSMSPLHPALIHMHLTGAAMADISRIVLVEKPDAPFSHSVAIQSLATTMTNVTVETLSCRSRHE